MSTAFLSAGILGQVYAQAVVDALSWRWAFGLAAPAFAIAAVAMAMILIEPHRSGELAAVGLVAEAISAGVLWALVIASVIFVLGIATIVPAVIALIGGRGASSRAAALALNGLYVFAGASCGPLVAQLPIGFTGLMLALAALLMIASGLVAISSRQTAEMSVEATFRQQGNRRSACARFRIEK